MYIKVKMGSSRPRQVCQRLTQMVWTIWVQTVSSWNSGVRIGMCVWCLISVSGELTISWWRPSCLNLNVLRVRPARLWHPDLIIIIIPVNVRSPASKATVNTLEAAVFYVSFVAYIFADRTCTEFTSLMIMIIHNFKAIFATQMTLSALVPLGLTTFVYSLSCERLSSHMFYGIEVYICVKVHRAYHLMSSFHRDLICSKDPANNRHLKVGSVWETLRTSACTVRRNRCPVNAAKHLI